MGTSWLTEDKALLEEDLPVVIINHTGYGHNNSANWEHDNTGCISNYSGCADIMLSAEAEHADWTEGYDY
jgi:hypothetical protein